jgi:hypothetical protein
MASPPSISTTTSTPGVLPFVVVTFYRSKLNIWRRVPDATIFSFLLHSRSTILNQTSLLDQLWSLVKRARGVVANGIRKHMSKVPQGSFAWYSRLFDFLFHFYESAISRSFYNFWFPAIIVY